MMKALGACIAIGMTITGCGSKGGNSPPPSSCGMVPACGGDIVGTWNVTDSCATITSSPMISGCPNASVQDTSFTATGTSTFNSDKTYTSSLTEMASETIVLPTSCLTMNGNTVTCVQLGQVLAGALMGDGGTSTTINCATSGSNCNCTISANGTAHATGTYSISGNSITNTPSNTPDGGTGVKSDFCVTSGGSELHVISTAMGVSTDVVATKQ